MDNMRLHHVYHTGANQKYYLAVLDYVNREKSYGVTVSKSSLSEFINDGTPQGTNVLSYQTFPDDSNLKKFNKKVIERSDLQFHEFTGRKILVDTHDSGDQDAYSRMVYGIVAPRVKCFPSKWYLENFNVVLLSTVSANPGVFPDRYPRTIHISCKFGAKLEGFYNHTVRETVKDYLRESFYGFTDFNWAAGRDAYARELQWTKIVVGAPGWGEYNHSYWGAMQAGALLFAHCSLNDIKLFPHSDLVDGDDFVSYNLYNFKIKLQRLLDRPDEIERIRKNGREKFKQGLNHKKSADQLVNHLKGESK